MNVRRYLRTADRFDNYVQITAKFASTGSCGHPINRGDTIGYNRRHQKTYCPACWRKWSAENAEAEAYERQNCSPEDFGGDW